MTHRLKGREQAGPLARRPAVRWIWDRLFAAVALVLNMSLLSFPYEYLYRPYQVVIWNRRA